MHLQHARTLVRGYLQPRLSPVRCFHSSVRRHQHFLNADSNTFRKAIANEEKVVLVDFYADWCNPCKMLSPILMTLTDDPGVKSGSGRALDLVTIDVDVHQEISQEYKVRAMPTVIAFRGGKQVDQFVGALAEPGVRKFLDKV